MNFEDIKYITFKERIKKDNKEAYKYIMELEESLKAEKEINNKVVSKLEKYENAIREKFGIKKNE